MSMRIRRAVARCLVRTGRRFDEGIVPCCESLSFAAGPILLLVGVSLVVLLSSLGYIYVIPLRSPDGMTQCFLYLYLTVGLLNLVARYIYTVGTNPGTPNSAIYGRLRRARELMKAEDCPKPPSLMAWSRCRHTGAPKPPRAHFDSVNKQLIVNFDHWCPWVFNSIGYGNYRHFVIFVGWVWLLTGSGAMLTVEPFFEGFKRGYAHDYHSEIAFAVVFCVCIALNVALGILFGWHLYLILSNQTSIDFLILKGRRDRVDPNYPNVFDLGSAWKNLGAILFSKGGGWWELFFPPRPYWPPLGEPYPGAFDTELDDLVH